ncbi:MAG: PilZ domain-containing protein [Myxococcota bacterium]
MATDSYREKRIATRLRTDTRCWVGDSGILRYAWIADLTEYGARVETSAPPDVGSKLHIRFVLMPEQSVEADVRVVWRAVGERGRAGVMGLHFECVLGRDAIRNYSLARWPTGETSD